MPCTPPPPSLAEECWPGPNILAICHGAQLLFRFPIHQMDRPDTQSATDTEQRAASRILYTHTILLTSLPVNGLTALYCKTLGKVCKIIGSWDSSDRGVCLNCVLLYGLSGQMITSNNRRKESRIILYFVYKQRRHSFWPASNKVGCV